MTSADNEQKPKWVDPLKEDLWKQKIIGEFNIHPVVAQVLVTRGFKSIKDIHKYLYAKLPDLLDPSLFAQMKEAIGRIHKAFINKEKVLVYGDNDVDGITGTVLLVEFLRFLNIEAEYYVPNRTSLDKSILSDAKDYANSKNCSLIITVDCGITAAAEIKEIIKDNIDVIISDHHEPTDKIPHCIATLNPKLINSTYPNRDLTGVGVAFKLIHGLANHFIKKKLLSPGKVDLKRYLDLVAIGTIADMGALQGENRILVRYGLKQLSRTKRIGLTKILSVCDINEEETTTTDIASKVAPRLNSLGRIANPMKGVEILLLHDEKAAEKMAIELDLNNIERQKIERKNSEEIEKYISHNPSILENKAIVLSSDNWHPGVIPIITARIAKQYNRPTIILSTENGLGKGSLRTIPEFPLLPILKQHASYLVNYGGHNFAAGLTIKEEHIPEFKESFIKTVNENLQDVDIIPKLQLDAKVSFNDLTFEFLESLKLLEPFGTGNPAPIFNAEALQTWPPKIIGKNHLKLYLEQNNRVLEGIAFGIAHRRQEIAKKNIKLRIAFTPYINTFLNKSSIQLLIKDFQTVD